jgi:hypothetical protein
MGSSFANKLIAMYTILQRVLPFTLPILTAMQSQNVISFLNSWNEFQVKSFKCVGLYIRKYIFLQRLSSGLRCCRRKLVLPKITSVLLPSLCLLFVVILTSAAIYDLAGRLSGFTRTLLIITTFNVAMNTQIMIIYWWWITCKSLQMASDVLLFRYKVNLCHEISGIFTFFKLFL